MTRDILRVVHLPARTPYVRKLSGDAFRIVNGSRISSGEEVPANVSATWMLARRPFDWFDVLHLHHVEFEPVAELERLLDACRAESKRIVFTAHDVRPMFSSDNQLAHRLSLLAKAETAWVFLTHGSVQPAKELVPSLTEWGVIPHGFVVAPDFLAERERSQPRVARRYMLYGSIRPNRDHISTIVNWSLGLRGEDSRLRLMLRAFSPADFSDGKRQIVDLVTIASADPRIEVVMRPYPTDAEIAEAALESDALLMPYLWGSHSGQLELAFDLNMLAVCSDVGFTRDQVQLHGGRVADPIWFDWTTGLPFLFGERFFAALESARAQLAERGPQLLDRDFLEYRREEHREILASYEAVYQG
jgi:hypothetical protein